MPGAQRQIKGLDKRLLNAEKALAKLATKTEEDPIVLQSKVVEILKRYRVTGYILYLPFAHSSALFRIITEVPRTKKICIFCLVNFSAIFLFILLGILSETIDKQGF